jgi:sensor histidine kinase YesM
MLAKLKAVKLKHKLYLLILLQLVVLTLIFGYMRTVVEKGLLQRLTELNSRINFRNVTDARDAILEMQNICSSTLNLGSPEVSLKLEQLVRQLGRYEDINISFRATRAQWMGYMQGASPIRRIALCAKEGQMVYVERESSTFFITLADPDADWMTETMKRRGGYYMAMNNGLFSLYRAVIVPSKYEKLGVIEVDADLSFLAENFERNKQFANQRYGLMVDGVQVAGDSTLNDRRLLEIVSAETPYQSILMDRAMGMIYLYYRLNGSEEIVSYTEIPYDAIYGQVFSQNRGAILAIAMYVALSFLIVAWTVRDMLRSLRVFERAFHEIEQGQFGHTINAPVAGELTGFLNAYNHMSVRLKQLIDEIYEKNLAQHQLELQMLRSQINPHFFYNTLEAVRMNCMLGREQQNIQMIEYLSAILRYGVSSGSEPVRLRDEIRQLEDYASLHNLRSDAKVELRVFIPPELQDQEIIRLLFQPLVENSIQHGLIDGDQTLTVCVMGYRDGDEIVFSVSDDGSGLSDEQADAINRCLAGEEADAKLGIGLRNVHRRIQLYYGEHYGLSIKSRPGRGTEVTVRIPFGGPAQ